MTYPIVQSVTLAAADDDGIAQSQTPVGAGNLTLNGALVTSGVAQITPALSGNGRQVIITSVGNESGHTFTITGTNESGNPQTETVTGANAGVAVSTKNYQTVTSVAISAAAAGAVTVGTNGVGASRWIGVDLFPPMINLGIGVVISGTVNFTWQYTYDNPNGTSTPTSWDLAALASKSANTDSATTQPIYAWRLQVNSGTGTATATVIQSGVSGY